MPGIKDIARAANVSLSAVSKAINGKPDISEATRERILKIAEEMDYHPSAFGRSLKNMRSENIGVIIRRDLQPLSGNPFYSRVLEGIEGELAINSYSLVLHLLPKQQDGRLPKMLREKKVDGVILVGPMENSFVGDIIKSGLPAVVVDPRHPSGDVTQVLIDNERGAYLATQHLIDHGHKKIGFISDELNRDSFIKRFSGFSNALKDNGIVLDKSFVRTAGHEQGSEHMKALLDALEIPTAILFANDLNALSGCAVIKDMGLSIPDDMSVVGFDDIFLSTMSSPSLTTVRVYKEEMGSIAVRNILKSLKDGIVDSSTTIVPVKLIERGSVSTLTPS